MPDQEITIVVKAASAPIESGANIPQGAIARVGARIQSTINGWFGPGESLAAQAPAGTEPRALDYPFGVNMQTNSRQLAPIPYRELREFARSYPLLRIAIEHMKDRICSKNWTIRLIRDPNDTPEQHAAKVKDDTSVKMLIALFQRPDGENSWRKWLRKLLGDYLIIDAAAVAVQRKNNGGIYRLMVVDGATIVRKIDEQGMTPMGRAEVAYQQVIKGIPAVDLAKRDLLFAPENVESDRLYGYSRVEQVLAWAILGMNRLLHQTAYYTEGSVPDVFAFLPEGTQSDAVEKYDAIYQKTMAGDSAKKRKVWWLPPSSHAPVQMKAEDLTDKMDEMLNRFICFAFGISPSALVSQVNRAAAGQMADDADEAGETPISGWVIDTINELIQSPQYGNLPGYEFAFVALEEVDTLIQKEIDQIDFAMAAQTGSENALTVLNEIRVRDGKPHLSGAPDPPPVPPGGDGSGGEDPVDPSVDDPDPVPPPKKAWQRKALSAPAAKGTVLTIDPGESTPAKAKAVKALAGVMRSFLAKQAGITAKAVGAAYARNKAALAARTKAKDGDPDYEAIADEILAEAGLDWSALPDLIDDLLQKAVTSGTARAASSLDAEHDIFAQANEYAIEYAEERGAELVGMKYVGGELVENPSAKWAITNTTRESLREIIVESLKDGDSPAMLKASIKAATDFSAKRADMIAITETNFANTGGQMEVARLVGHTHKRSLLSGDHDVDDDCDDNAAADDLEFGDLFPSGAFSSPFHPFCVCLTQTYNKGAELTGDDAAG
jgi:hypothetical protein